MNNSEKQRIGKFSIQEVLQPLREAGKSASFDNFLEAPGRPGRSRMLVHVAINSLLFLQLSHIPLP